MTLRIDFDYCVTNSKHNPESELKMSEITRLEPNSYLALQSFVRRTRFVLAAVPALIVVPAFWFTYTEMLRAAAKVQFVVEAANAGLLRNPGVKNVAENMLSGNAAYGVFLFAAAVVTLLCLAHARRARLVSKAAANQLAYENEQACENEFSRSQSTSYEPVCMHGREPCSSDSVTPFFPPPHTNWMAKAYPLKLMSIQAQGTRHCSRAEVIAHLETALDRLKKGEIQGEMSDDDDGYRFIEVQEMDRSIFNAPSSYR